MHNKKTRHLSKGELAKMDMHRPLAIAANVAERMKQIIDESEQKSALSTQRDKERGNDLN